MTEDTGIQRVEAFRAPDGTLHPTAQKALQHLAAYRLNRLCGQIASDLGRDIHGHAVRRVLLERLHDVVATLDAVHKAGVEP
jgi:hypothetical protein